jgi:hypothetical protein
MLTPEKRRLTAHSGRTTEEIYLYEYLNCRKFLGDMSTPERLRGSGSMGRNSVVQRLQPLSPALILISVVIGRSTGALARSYEYSLPYQHRGGGNDG